MLASGDSDKTQINLLSCSNSDSMTPFLFFFDIQILEKFVACQAESTENLKSLVPSTYYYISFAWNGVLLFSLLLSSFLRLPSLILAFPSPCPYFDTDSHCKIYIYITEILSIEDIKTLCGLNEIICVMSLSQQLPHSKSSRNNLSFSPSHLTLTTTLAGKEVTHPRPITKIEILIQVFWL